VKEVLQRYRDIIDILPPAAQRFLVGYSALLGALSILDGAALGLLALAIEPILSGGGVSLPFVGEVAGGGLLIMLAIVCLLIILKGALSVLLIWRATRTFARFELVIGSRLFDSYLKSSWVERLKRNSADVVRLTDSSVSAMVSSYLRPIATVPGEIFSFITVVVVLAIVDPVTAGITLVYLGLLGLILFFWVTKRSREAGRVALRHALKSSRLITEMVGALKEVTLRNKADEAAEVVRSNRFHTTRARSNAQFLAQVPRYILESGIIGGFVVVGIAGFLVGGLEGATTSVALFGLAGFRMAPSVVRFQSIVSQVSVSIPHVDAVLTEIRRSELSSKEQQSVTEVPLPDEPRDLVFDDVTFRYTDDSPNAVTDVSLSIKFGSAVAFVGASGAGKSTIVDLLLGLLSPTEGTIEIDGIPLAALSNSWRSKVAYVPQDVSLFDASVAQNVALTWTGNFDPDRVRRALEQAQLLDIIEARQGGINSIIGERGLSLSGGQRQRLGIARALYADPLVLVMDEATSALDTATEAAVTDAIRNLRGSITIITVAHRLATVKASDEIFFMRNSSLIASGDFAKLVSTVPDFAHQARLAGLAGD
jgi:ATP-binding cassette subfamily C protein